MLPPQHKLTNSEAFKAAIRKGKHAGRSTVVVHIRLVEHQIAITGGPKMGLVVSKAIGNAVTRHRVSRQLRHAFMRHSHLLPRNAEVVLRALPPIDVATAQQVDQDVLAGIEKALRKAGL